MASTDEEVVIPTTRMASSALNTSHDMHMNGDVNDNRTDTSQGLLMHRSEATHTSHNININDRDTNDKHIHASNGILIHTHQTTHPQTQNHSDAYSHKLPDKRAVTHTGGDCADTHNNAGNHGSVHTFSDAQSHASIEHRGRLASLQSTKIDATANHENETHALIKGSEGFAALRRMDLVATVNHEAGNALSRKYALQKRLALLQERDSDSSSDGCGNSFDVVECPLIASHDLYKLENGNRQTGVDALRPVKSASRQHRESMRAFPIQKMFTESFESNHSQTQTQTQNQELFKPQKGSQECLKEHKVLHEDCDNHSATPLPHTFKSAGATLTPYYHGLGGVEFDRHHTSVTDARVTDGVTRPPGGLSFEPQQQYGALHDATGQNNHDLTEPASLRSDRSHAKPPHIDVSSAEWSPLNTENLASRHALPLNSPLRLLYPYTEATYIPQHDVLDDGEPPKPRAGPPEMHMELQVLVYDAQHLPKLRDGDASSHYICEVSFQDQSRKTLVKAGNAIDGCAFMERLALHVHEMSLDLAKFARGTDAHGPIITCALHDCGRYARNDLLGRMHVCLKDLTVEEGDGTSEDAPKTIRYCETLQGPDGQTLIGVDGQETVLCIVFRPIVHNSDKWTPPTLTQTLESCEKPLQLRNAPKASESLGTFLRTPSEMSNGMDDDNGVVATVSLNAKSSYWRERLEEKMDSLAVTCFVIVLVCIDVGQLIFYSFIEPAPDDGSEAIAHILLTIIVLAFFVLELTLRQVRVCSCVVDLFLHDGLDT